MARPRAQRIRRGRIQTIQISSGNGAIEGAGVVNHLAVITHYYNSGRVGADIHGHCSSLGNTGITNRRVSEGVGTGSSWISRVVHGAICIDDHAALATLGYARDLDVCTFKVIIGQNINVHCLAWSCVGSVIKGILLRHHHNIYCSSSFSSTAIVNNNLKRSITVPIRIRSKCVFSRIRVQLNPSISWLINQLIAQRVVIRVDSKSFAVVNLILIHDYVVAA